MKRVTLLCLCILTSIALLTISGCDFLFNSTPDVSSITAAESELAEGESTTITAVGYDSDDDQITYTFSATIGTLSVTSNTTGIVTYTAPTWVAGQPTAAGITVEVSDALTDEIDDTGEKEVTIQLLGREKTLQLQIPSTYFTSLGTTSLDVIIDGDTVDTIASSEITTNPTLFDVAYYGAIGSVRFETGTYSTTFDELDDFASNDDTSVTTMGGIQKIQIYASWSWLSDAYVGTGAYVKPLE